MLLLVGFTTPEKSTLRLSNVLHRNEVGKLQTMEFPFFDEEDTWIYFEVDRLADSTTSGWIQIKQNNKTLEWKRPLLQHSFRWNTSTSTYIDSMSIASLPSGNYMLLWGYGSADSKPQEVGNIPFQVLHSQVQQLPKIEEEALPLPAPDSISFRDSFVKNYNLKQLQRNTAALFPIAAASERFVVRDAEAITDLQLLQRFFYIFWYERNASNPEKAWKEYTEKLNYVASKYGTSLRKGYESDRGRVYLAFGAPDKIEFVLREKDARPYEIWFYYATKGRTNVKFLFMQPGMQVNEMILLHSTEKDEMYNPEWRRYLLLNDPTNDGANKLKHRVFEYFQQ
jgi:GWxTD domain-containing protein